MTRSLARLPWALHAVGLSLAGLLGGGPLAQEPVLRPDVAFRAAGLDWLGTLVVPPGNTPCPAVLLIPPAGTYNRNQVVSGGQQFRDLAQRYAAAGIASLRYERARQDEDTGSELTVEQLAEVAVSALRTLIAHPRTHPQQVGLLAHGDGCLQALLAAVEPTVAFAVLLAPPGLDGASTLAHRMAGFMPEEQRSAAVDELRMAIAGSAEGDRSGFLAVVTRLLTGMAIPTDAAEKTAAELADEMAQTWQRSYIRHDPTARLRLRCAVLLLAGADDERHPPELHLPPLREAIAAGLSEHAPAPTDAVLPDLGHFLSPADASENILFDPEIVARSTRWILARTSAR